MIASNINTKRPITNECETAIARNGKWTTLLLSTLHNGILALTFNGDVNDSVALIREINDNRDSNNPTDICVLLESLGFQYIITETWLNVAAIPQDQLLAINA